MAKKLTHKQRKFCIEYLVDGNGAQSAIRAGYSKKTAKQIAAENLAKPYLMAEIERKRAKQAERTKITADSVLKRLDQVANRCMQITPVLDKNGKPTGEYKFDSSGANQALSLLGKHFKLFTEKHEVTGKDGNPLFSDYSDDQIREYIKNNT